MLIKDMDCELIILVQKRGDITMSIYKKMPCSITVAFNNEDAIINELTEMSMDGDYIKVGCRLDALNKEDEIGVYSI
jgi:hypothetical protein